MLALIALPCHRRSVGARDVTWTDSRLAARCAAVASFGAAVIHFAVTPMHWRDWLPSGVFFAALATFQLVWAFFAWSRPGALVLSAGIVANVGAAGLWVMACVSGPPFGPAAGEPEAVGAAGICVLLLQCYVVMGSAWAWSRKYQADEVSGLGRSVVLMGASTIMAGAVTVGLAASLQGHGHHHHGAAVEAQGGHHATPEANMEGHQHPLEAQVPDADGVRTPPLPLQQDGQGLPVTDMSLDMDADQGHSAPADSPVVAPGAKTAPPESESPESDSGGETDGHQHHHDD